MDFKEQLLELDQCKKALQGEIILCDSLRAENQALKAENARLRAIIDDANAQEPSHYAREDGGAVSAEILECGTDEQKALYCIPLYSAPIPAQQSPRITEQDAPDKNSAKWLDELSSRSLNLQNDINTVFDNALNKLNNNQ